MFLYLPLTFVMQFVLLTGCGVRTDESSGNETIQQSLASGERGSQASIVNDSAFSFSEGIDENGFWEGVRALDHVAIFNYRAMPIPRDVHHVPDEFIQNEIRAILASIGGWDGEPIFDRAVVNGDTVNIDFVGSIDGTPFAGGSTEGMGTNVIIGVTDYIDDFLEQLIGRLPGETVNVEVTFPEDYLAQSLQGQDALFVTAINYIVGVGMTQLTDDFVNDNLSFLGWTTVAEMEEALKADYRLDAIQQYLRNYFANEVTVRSIPSQLKSYQEWSMISYYMELAEIRGMELEEIIMDEGASSIDELVMMNWGRIVERATTSLVAQAIAEDAGLSVSEQDMADHFAEYAWSDDYSILIEDYGLPYLRQTVLHQMVLDYILENAVFE